MIKQISREIRIEELPNEKKFKVFLNTIDLADPEDLLRNMEQIKQAIDFDKQAIKVDREKLEEQIATNEKSLGEMQKIEQTARIWKKENDLLNQRKGSKPNQEQQGKANTDYTG